ncbi:hypothetical protein BG011_001341 [Mortierella polycephala]|uniref:Transposase n=1 Tax=Mortierella polycephala TaxID=41804 RepID=A0A9P6PGM9_9FUNG|nr:hypothetical protein BG011_001341 [Mortierella polycephala]
MAYSEDLRWRAVILYSFMGVKLGEVEALLGATRHSIRKWAGQVVEPTESPIATCRRWREEVYDHVRRYVEDHPCFYLEELQASVKSAFPKLPNTSIPTICRALRMDIKLSRKVLQKQAREAIPQELEDYRYRLRPSYNFQEQLVFIDGTSKDRRAALRKYVWSL